MIGTLRRELFVRALVLGEQHLRLILQELLAHYNAVRPHCALGQLSPSQVETCEPDAGKHGRAARAVPSRNRPAAARSDDLVAVRCGAERLSIFIQLCRLRVRFSPAAPSMSMML